MKLAFYAPLKPPDHPVPSGERTMARAVITALTHIGAQVDLASTLRSRDGAGKAARQAELITQAEGEIASLIARGAQAGWQAWVTYHNYYKAPDLLGPLVSRALGIPYLQIESTRARKRLNGPWHRFAQAAETASDAADVIFYFTAQDSEALFRDAPAGQQLIHLSPFLTRDTLPEASSGTGPLLSVAMMRRGDKLASYRLIADTLHHLGDVPWQLQIAGDGPARDAVTALMHPFSERVQFLGKLGPEALAQAYRSASVLFWPGVNEAFGLSYLEAQAHGLPVVAQDRPGVRDVLAPGVYPAAEHGAEALAARLTTFLTDHTARAAAARIARDHIAENHLLPQAADCLAHGLAHVGVRA